MRIRHAPQPGRGLGMPIEAWPAADQQAWHAAFVPRDPFDDRADVSQMREATRTKIAVAYARWLCWLQDHHPDSLALPAAQRVTEAAVIAYLTALMAEISARGAAHYAACLRSALTIVAPDADWSWLMPIVGRLHRRAQAAPKARRPFVPTTELFVYGVDLMRAAEAAPDANPIDRAVAFRDGLMLAFLAARPLRLK